MGTLIWRADSNKSEQEESNRRLQSFFVQLDDIRPRGHRGKRFHGDAALGRDLSKPSGKPLASGVVFRSAGQDALIPLPNLILAHAAAGRSHPRENLFIGSTVQNSALQIFALEVQEVEQVFVESDGEIIVILNLPRVTQANFVDDPRQMGEPAEPNFWASWIMHGRL